MQHNLNASQWKCLCKIARHILAIQHTVHPEYALPCVRNDLFHIGLAVWLQTRKDHSTGGEGVDSHASEKDGREGGDGRRGWRRWWCTKTIQVDPLHGLFQPVLGVCQLCQWRGRYPRGFQRIGQQCRYCSCEPSHCQHSIAQVGHCQGSNLHFQSARCQESGSKWNAPDNHQGHDCFGICAWQRGPWSSSSWRISSTRMAVSHCNPVARITSMDKGHAF